MPSHVRLPSTGRGTPADQQAFDALFDRFGPLLPCTALPRVLGYPTPSAFRQAVARGTVPVPIFKIPTRRGWFALASDVATWLAACKSSNYLLEPTHQALGKPAGIAGSLMGQT